MNLLVDTNVLSFIYKKDSRSASYENHLKGNFLIISFMTLAELKFWTLKNNWGEKKRQFCEISQRLFCNLPGRKTLRNLGGNKKRRSQKRQSDRYG